MSFLYIKSLHIIFVITWFAGLFYLGRLFVYHAEAGEKPEPDSTILHNQYIIMERRLWSIITVPSAFLTVLTGTHLASHFMPITEEPWLMAKLGLVFALLIYHLSCGKMRKGFAINRTKWSSYQMRLWNELPTLILFGIIFLVILKDLASMLWGTIGLFALGVVLALIVKRYKKFREQNEKNPS